MGTSCDSQPKQPRNNVSVGMREKSPSLLVCFGVSVGKTTKTDGPADIDLAGGRNRPG